MISNPLVVMLILLTLTVVLGYVGIINYADGRSQQLEALGRGGPAATSRETGRQLRTSVERYTERTRSGRRFARAMTAAGLARHLADAVLISVVVVGSAGAAGWWFLGPVAGVLAALLAVALLRAVLQSLISRRREQFVAQLPQLSRLLANGATAGLSLRRSVTAAAVELAEPARSELLAVSDGLAVGMPLEAALDQLDERLASRELSVLVKTLVIHVRAGGGLVTALQRMSQTLEARKKLRSEIIGLLAAAKYTAFALPVLTVILVLAITGGDREVLRLFFTEPIGQGALVFTGVVGGLGIIIIRRILRSVV